MAKYGIGSVNLTTAVTTYKTLLKITPVATAGPVQLVYIGIFGAGNATPASVQHEMQGGHLSDAGAGTLTAYTPDPFWMVSSAKRATYGINATVEPTTYTPEFPLAAGFNQLNGYMWGVPDGQGLYADAGATIKNVGVRHRSSAAGSIDYNFHVIEP